MSSEFPISRLTGLGLLNQRVSNLEVSEEYIYLDITLYGSNPSQYAPLFFQDKIVILADLQIETNLGIPSPINIPRADGKKIRLMSNFTNTWSNVAEIQSVYKIYTLLDNNTNNELVQEMYGQTYLTLVWDSIAQKWYPIRDIVQKNATVTIARPGGS